MSQPYIKYLHKAGAIGFTALVGLSLYSLFSEDTSGHYSAEPSAPIVISALTPDNGELSGVAPEQTPSAIQDLLAPSDMVIKAFKVNNFHAWVIRHTEGVNTVYLTTEDNSVVLTGAFLYKNNQGEVVDLNKQIAQRYSGALKASTQWNMLADSDFIHEGADPSLNKPIIYAFFDPDCEYCHLSWLAFKPYVDTKEVDLRWIPTAVLSEEARSKVAYLLQSDSPKNAFTRSHLRWEIGSGESSFISTEDVSVESAFKIERNNGLLNDLKIEGAPAFVYKDSDDRVNIASGAMYLDEIARLLDVEEIINNDPRVDVLRKKEPKKID